MTVVHRLRLWWVRTPYRVRQSKLIAAELGRVAGVVIDVGGGRESGLFRYAPRVTRRIRVDVSSRHRPDVIADAHHMPFLCEAVDAVLAAEVIEHLEFPDRAIAEWHRVLRPGGVLVASIPFLFPVHADPDDFSRRTASGLRSLTKPFASTDVRSVGSAWSSAFTILALSSRWIRAVMPLIRFLSRSDDPAAPMGYQLVARKADHR